MSLKEELREFFCDFWLLSSKKQKPHSAKEFGVKQFVKLEDGCIGWGIVDSITVNSNSYVFFIKDNNPVNAHIRKCLKDDNGNEYYAEVNDVTEFELVFSRFMDDNREMSNEWVNLTDYRQKERGPKRKGKSTNTAEHSKKKKTSESLTIFANKVLLFLHRMFYRYDLSFSTTNHGIYRYIELECGNDYGIVDTISIDGCLYYFLMKEDDIDDFCIRKAISEDGEEYVVGLDNEEEFSRAWSVFVSPDRKKSFCWISLSKYKEQAKEVRAMRENRSRQRRVLRIFLFLTFALLFSFLFGFFMYFVK